MLIALVVFSVTDLLKENTCLQIPEFLPYPSSKITRGMTNNFTLTCFGLYKYFNGMYRHFHQKPSCTWKQQLNFLEGTCINSTVLALCFCDKWTNPSAKDRDPQLIIINWKRINSYYVLPASSKCFENHLFRKSSSHSWIKLDLTFNPLCLLQLSAF